MSRIFGSLLLAALVLASHRAGAQPVRVDVAPGGLPADGPSMYATVSYDGRYVAFVSAASNLVAGEAVNTWNIYRFDREAGVLIRAAARPHRFETIPRIVSISHDGRVVLFSSFESDWRRT